MVDKVESKTSPYDLAVEKPVVIDDKPLTIPKKKTDNTKELIGRLVNEELFRKITESGYSTSTKNYKTVPYIYSHHMGGWEWINCSNLEGANLTHQERNSQMYKDDIKEFEACEVAHSNSIEQAVKKTYEVKKFDKSSKLLLSSVSFVRGNYGSQDQKGYIPFRDFDFVVYTFKVKQPVTRNDKIVSKRGESQQCILSVSKGPGNSTFDENGRIVESATQGTSHRTYYNAFFDLHCEAPSKFLGNYRAVDDNWLGRREELVDMIIGALITDDKDKD